MQHTKSASVWLAALSAVALAASPALAATATGTDTTTNGANSSSDNIQSPHMMRIRQHITQQLEQEGFKDVHVVPDSFLVNAENKQGERVVMIINPNSVFSMTQIASSNGPNAKNGETSGMSHTTNGTSTSSENGTTKTQ